VDVDSLWDKLRRRKVVQWGLPTPRCVGLLQGLEYVSDTFAGRSSCSRSRPSRCSSACRSSSSSPGTTRSWRATRHGHRTDDHHLLFLVGAHLLALRARSRGGAPGCDVDLAAATAPSSTTPTADQQSVAVLPFVNMSDAQEPSTSPTAREEILNALAQVPGLRVPSRTSSFSFRGKQVDLKSWRGTARRARPGGQRAPRWPAHPRHCAADRRAFRQPPVVEDLGPPARGHLTVQQEIAQEIADTLEVQFAGGGGPAPGHAERRGLRTLPAGPVPVAAARRGPLRTSIEQFEAAIRLDPAFARAHSALAASHAVLVSYTGAEVPVETLLNAPRRTRSGR